VLVGVHSFRLPLELMLHEAYASGLMPELQRPQLDIVTGALAVALALLLATGRAELGAVRAWNWLGTLLLLNIIVISLPSTPTPLRVFKSDPPTRSSLARPTSGCPP
jgi:hypothetical protein